MSLYVVGFMMLLPALMAATVVIGTLALIGYLVYPYLRGYLPGKHPATSRILRIRDRRSGSDRRGKSEQTHHQDHPLAA